MILSSLIAMISQNYLPAIKTIAASYSDKNLKSYVGIGT